MPPRPFYALLLLTILNSMQMYLRSVSLFGDLLDVASVSQGLMLSGYLRLEYLVVNVNSWCLSTVLECLSHRCTDAITGQHCWYPAYTCTCISTLLTKTILRSVNTCTYTCMEFRCMEFCLWRHRETVFKIAFCFLMSLVEKQLNWKLTWVQCLSPNRRYLYLLEYG